MISSLEKFQTKFVEEALDNIEELEQALMALENSPENSDLLEQIFRIMHSLKGGGAMFGFERLSEFAHHMESLYELIRSGTMRLTPGLLSVTFRSVDLMRNMLDDRSSGTNEVFSLAKQIIGEVTRFISGSVPETKSGIESPVPLTEQEHRGIITWHISFHPGENVLSNGINILYLLDELSQLGNFFAVPRSKNVPDFDSFLPHVTYFWWDLFLATDSGENEILDVFLFVEPESDIHINLLVDRDLFCDHRFVSYLEKLRKNDFSVQLTELKQVYTEPELKSAESYEVSEHESDQLSLSSTHQTKANGSIRVASGKIDQLMNLVSEMVISQERLGDIATHHSIPQLTQVSQHIQKLTTLLRDTTFSISLVPLDSLTIRFRRLVRDLSSRLGKEIEFKVQGAETELDKSMIDNLADPLLHIIRNAIDHGIETPRERQKRGKSLPGRISLKAGYSGANVLLEISDDGAGIDHQKVLQKAIEKGLVSSSHLLTPQQIVELVFLPGFSTLSGVTDISGRGVGMDVVKRNIEAIRGDVKIISDKGKGTTISIMLPLILSIIDGLLVQIGDNKFIIPLNVVDRLYSTGSEEIRNSFLEVIHLDGQQLSFIDLRKEMSVPGLYPKVIQMVVISQGDEKLAVSVDKVIGNIQAVLKPLGTHYQYQKIISAATIMGNGSIALVVDVNQLFKIISKKAN